MYVVDTVVGDLSNVIFCYHNAYRAHENRNVPSIVFCPFVFEALMVGVIPLGTIVGSYQMMTGTLSWDEFKERAIGTINMAKYSPIFIIAATALAAKYSKKALATLAGAYVVRVIIP